MDGRCPGRPTKESRERKRKRKPPQHGEGKGEVVLGVKPSPNLINPRVIVDKMVCNKISGIFRVWAKIWFFVAFLFTHNFD